MSDTIGAIRACGYLVVVEPEDQEKKTESGIIIPQKQRAEQEIGRLVAIGPLAWSDHGKGEPWAEVGDRVLYSKYGGKMIDDPGSGIRYRVINDEDIFAVVDSEADINQENYDGETSKWNLEEAV